MLRLAWLGVFLGLNGIVAVAGAQTLTDEEGIDLAVVVEFEDAELKQHEPRIRILLQESFSEYAGLFGGMPKRLDGTPYTQIRLKVGHGVGSESAPEFIELKIDDTKFDGFYSWEIVLLHEVFHLWSAETFRYASEQEQWFNEGTALYYAFKLAAKLGIIPAEDIVSRFSLPVARYLSAKGAGRISMSKAATLDDGKLDHFFLITNGGFTALMVLDHQIRQSSKGPFTLDYLMRELYLNNSRLKPYSNATLIELIERSTGYQAGRFFQQHITGARLIQVGRYFDLGHLEYRQKLGLPIKDESQQVLVQVLSP